MLAVRFLGSARTCRPIPTCLSCTGMAKGTGPARGGGRAANSKAHLRLGANWCCQSRWQARVVRGSAEKISRPRAAASGRPATRWTSSRRPLIKLGGHAERREGGGFTGTCAPDESGVLAGNGAKKISRPRARASGERGGWRGPNLAISANFRTNPSLCHPKNRSGTHSRKTTNLIDRISI